jgi:hypothetical protein
MELNIRLISLAQIKSLKGEGIASHMEALVDH